MDKKNTPQWRYKEKAIGEAAAAFRSALNDDWLNIATLVPIPPSKAKDNPFYDDRLVRMLQGIRTEPDLDLRELIIQHTSTVAVHDQENRPSPDQIQANYRIDNPLREPLPQVIGLFDDVLTTGAHYRAASAVLRQNFPGVRVIGFFIARRVPEAVDIEDFEP
jgi:predicted amidophosphoribosyltransferase